MSEIKLTSPIPPSVNHYLGYRAIMKNGKPMATSYCTSEAKKYKKFMTAYVKDEVAKQGWDMPVTDTQHFYVDATFYFPRVDMDSNNTWKCLLDSITDSGMIWKDDNVVCERTQGIYYDSENPRVEIVIHPVDYIGVFDNAAQLEEFESNCIGCKRYKRNCSILGKAKLGRIQKEVLNGVCIKNSKGGN